MKEFQVTVTETLERIDLVQAKSEVQAITLVERQRRDGDIVLTAHDYTGVDFAVKETPYVVEITYGEMKQHFRDMERTYRHHTEGYIVFSAESFRSPYDETARTYAVKSDCKAF